MGDEPREAVAGGAENGSHPAPSLRRDPPAATASSYDLIVVGGGIYGAMTALEAARRGLSPLLLERDDFGGATSWNSHRIVHGGLRYLQRFDLQRFRTSVTERAWFLRHFPDLVEPLPCLMPLYGDGARRPSVLRIALAINHMLSRHRNDDVRSDRRIESGGVMTVPETKSLFPGVRTEGLRGGALWYDAVMTDSQRVLIETLRWASAYGARCLNYVEATGLQSAAGRVAGVDATDTITGEALRFEAPLVINCAGPWSADVARSFDRPVDGLFRASRAFNLLFDRAPPSEVAIAVSAPSPGAHTWFLYPRGGRTYAGTAHLPGGADRSGAPTEVEIQAAIDDMNAAVPGLDLCRDQLVRVYSGLLPATAAGSTELTTKPSVHDHGHEDGPAGLFSVSGVKFTTARDVAETTLRRALGAIADVAEESERPRAHEPPSAAGISQADGLAALPEETRSWAEDEAVVHLDDLLLRRGDWADDVGRDDTSDT